MNILVRLPNWLGDLIMSLGFIQSIRQVYPDAIVSVIVKKGIHELMEFFRITVSYMFFQKRSTLV